MSRSYFLAFALPFALAACSTDRVVVSERAAATASIQTKKLLSLDDIYDPDKKLDFSGKSPPRLVWLDDGRYLWPRTDPKTKKPDWITVDAATGKERPFDGVAQTVTLLSQIEGVDADEARRMAHDDPKVFARESRTQLFTIESDLYSYTFGAGAIVRLTDTTEEEEEAALSPDGKRVAFVRQNDLYVVGGDPVVERRITNDGGELVLNGKLDWLYQEEVYGRGNYKAHWWSPDSRWLAFLRLDETGVPLYTLVDDVPHVQTVEVSPYPRPGEPNPTVKLAVADTSGDVANVHWVDLSAYASIEFLIVDVAWSPSGELAFQVQDREQTWLDLVVFDPKTGASKTLFRETSPAFVSMNGSPTWLDDGSFLWFSERTGWQHLYHYKPDGTLVRQVTDGKFEVRTLHGVDAKSGTVYFSGTERSHIGSDAYRVKLDGSGRERLTKDEGTHTVAFSPEYTYFVDSWSDVTTPTQVFLHKSSGERVRTIEANPVAALDEYALVKPEFLRVKTKSGFEMEAMLIKPLGFDPNVRYPVFQWTYAGPHAPQVRNAWLGTNGMFYQLLAQRGIVVWVCDNQTASGKGAESVWPGYMNFGVSELADIEDGLAWLKSQSWVDPSRIGISGWSYGGMMTAYALTHSRSFAMGIAGGSVTDWRQYDSIYTERLMKTPKNNPGGYERTSVTAAAKDLSGRILLIHGAMDDNVHPQNTIQLADALQRAGKPFEMMLYPKARHGVTNPKQVKHLRMTMLDFIERTLLGADQTPASP